MGVWGRVGLGSVNVGPLVGAFGVVGGEHGMFTGVPVVLCATSGSTGKASSSSVGRSGLNDLSNRWGSSLVLRMSLRFLRYTRPLGNITE